MKTLRLYQHERNRDVAIMPLEIVRLEHKKGYGMLVRYYNVANVSLGSKPWSMSIEDRVFVSDEQLPNYRDVTHFLDKEER